MVFLEVSVPSDIVVGENSTVGVQLPVDAGGNVTLKVDGEVVDVEDVVNGAVNLTLPSLSAGNHSVEISYSGDDKYNPSAKSTVISTDKELTNLNAANVTVKYGEDKNLVITLTDSQANPIANATVKVVLDTARNYTSDENGQINVKISNLIPNTYSAAITFDGDDYFIESSTTANVVVKKATPKLVASKKTFKTTVKTKKYIISLKDSNGNAIKNAKVTLKVNGKTYKATTNSKGKATFKITKLTKKGTFKATITYNGNKYYNKATKKVKLTVKSAFKTVSKGSKDKVTVKKIQRALKNNGFYISYNGHYLKVDGIYQGYTEMAVKQFQKAKGLKVTGKWMKKPLKN